MISSTKNNEIKNVVALQKKSKERKKQKLFVVEGAKMVFEAPKYWVDKVYVSSSYLENEEKKQILLSSGLSYEEVTDAVFSFISDTQTPQGILALIKMPEYTLESVVKEDCPLFLILESIQDPGNLGTMIRTGEGAGVTAVIVNQTTVDLYNPKTIRSTMGSIYRIPFIVVSDLKETVAVLKNAGVSIYAAHLKGKAFYSQMDYTLPTGFMIGNEGNGLTTELSDCADKYIKIPMEGQVESLNAAISASLLMYECNRQRRL